MFFKGVSNTHGFKIQTGFEKCERETKLLFFVQLFF